MSVRMDNSVIFEEIKKGFSEKQKRIILSMLYDMRPEYVPLKDFDIKLPDSYKIEWGKQRQMNIENMVYSRAILSIKESIT